MSFIMLSDNVIEHAVTQVYYFVIGAHVNPLAHSYEEQQSKQSQEDISGDFEENAVEWV